MTNVYSFTVKDRQGNDVCLKDYSGKVLLIVNTATACGFTPQYEGLEAIYEELHDKGFEILDFPCNQFGSQAPGSDEEIHEFCTLKYNTKFPRFRKLDVNGENEDPLFAYLKSQKGFAGFDMNSRLGPRLDKMFRDKDPNYEASPDIKWNFTKFLIDKEGNVAERFEPTAEPAEIAERVKELL